MHVCQSWGQVKYSTCTWYLKSAPARQRVTWTDPRPAVRPAEGPNLFHWKKVKLEILLCFTKFHEPYVVLEYAHFSNNIIAMKTPSSHTPITGFYTKGRPLVKSNLIGPLDKLSWQPGCPILNINIQGNFFISQGNGSSDKLPKNLV